jgi:hypothetical protein
MKKILSKATVALVLISFFSCEKFDSKSTQQGQGGDVYTRNGSLTRIVSNGNYAYIVGNSKLKTIDLSNPQNMQQTDSKTIGSLIQTIFIKDGQLYIGAANNLYVYGLSNPAAPSLTSTINYAPVNLARDPVIAFDSVIYSTVIYGPGNGLLRTINNKNIQAPTVISTFLLNEPRGMDVADSTLYVCNGFNGLTLFNIKNPFIPTVLKAIDQGNTLSTITSTSNNQYLDVLAIKPYMYCYIKGGVVQYNISNSRLPVYLNTIN